MDNHAIVQVFLFMGSCMILAGLVMVFLAHRSASWPPTIGVVIKSHVNHLGGDGNSWKPVVEYEFEIDGEKFKGNRLRLFTGTCFIPQLAQKQITAYAEGQSVKVYFNPRNPNHSVLLPGIAGSWVAISGMILGGFALLYASTHINTKTPVMRSGSCAPGRFPWTATAAAHAPPPHPASPWEAGMKS